MAAPIQAEQRNSGDAYLELGAASTPIYLDAGVGRCPFAQVLLNYRRLPARHDGSPATKAGLEVLALGEFHWTGEGSAIIFVGFGIFAKRFKI